MTPAELDRWRRMVRRLGLAAPKPEVRPAPAQKKEVATVRDEARESRAAAPPARPGFRRQCDAVDPDSGRRCSLLGGHPSVHNASGRPFARALQPGEQVVRRLDAIAISRPRGQYEGAV